MARPGGLRHRTRRRKEDTVTVWLLTENRGREHDDVGLYGSREAARRAVCDLVGSAAVDWRDGGPDSVTLAFVPQGDGTVRTFQIYPLELGSAADGPQDD